MDADEGLMVVSTENSVAEEGFNERLDEGPATTEV